MPTVVQRVHQLPVGITNRSTVSHTQCVTDGCSLGFAKRHAERSSNSKPECRANCTSVCVAISITERVAHGDAQRITNTCTHCSDCDPISDTHDKPNFNTQRVAYALTDSSTKRVANRGPISGTDGRAVVGTYSQPNRDAVCVTNADTHCCTKFVAVISSFERTIGQPDCIANCSTHNRPNCAANRVSICGTDSCAICEPNRDAKPLTDTRTNH